MEVTVTKVNESAVVTTFKIWSINQIYLFIYIIGTLESASVHTRWTWIELNCPHHQLIGAVVQNWPICFVHFVHSTQLGGQKYLAFVKLKASDSTVLEEPLSLSIFPVAPYYL